MFSIGDFANLTRLSVRTLRLYDEMGLFPPASVDPATGYRRYSVAQLPRLNRLVALRDLGFTLAQIGPLLDGEVSAEKLEGMLLMRRAQLAERIGQEQERLAEVEARLRQIGRENEMPSHEVVVRPLPAVRVATIPSPAPGFGIANLGSILRPGYQRVRDYLTSQGVEATGPMFAFYEGDPEAGTLTAFPSIPIGDTELTPEDPVVIRHLAEVPEAATVVINGRPDFRALYTDIGRWIEEHGYTFVGHGRDVVLDFDADDPSKLVMEVRWPITKSADARPTE